MTIRRRVAALACAVGLSLVSPALAEEPAPAPPTAVPHPGADVGSQDTALETRAAKINAYVPYLTDTQRAVTSLNRYASWVNMKTGPTGRERIIYGLYDVYDTAREEAAATAALSITPPLPDLDAAMRDFIPKYNALAPVLTKANSYYDREDYNLMVTTAKTATQFAK